MVTAVVSNKVPEVRPPIRQEIHQLKARYEETQGCEFTYNKGAGQDRLGEKGNLLISEKGFIRIPNESLM